MRRTPPRPSARGCRSRPKVAGRASPRSSARRSRRSPAELDAVLTRRAETESHLTGGGRDALLALRGATQRLGVRHESAQRLLAELRASSRLRSTRRPARRPRSSVAPRTRPTRPRARPHASATILTRASSSPASGSSRSSSRSRSGRGSRRRRVRSPRQASGSRCRCWRSQPGSERSVAAALGHRASAVLVDDPQRGLQLVEQAMAAGLGSVLVLIGRDPRRLVDLPVVAARGASLVERPRGDRRRHRLGPGPRRAVVRRRDRRGRAARAGRRGVASSRPRWSR